MDEELEGRVSLRIGDLQPTAPYVLPRWDVLSAGRLAGYGLHIPNSWVPNRLCRFLPFELGWVVQVGPSARMRVQDAYIGDHVFEPRSMVALQPGRTRLRFPELDDHCEMVVVIGHGAATGHQVVADSVVEDEPRFRTQFAVSRVVLTPKQRRVVATTFAYLIKGGQKPTNLTATAAATLGVSEQSVKNSLAAIRSKINLERWGPALEGYEPVGHYLVVLSRNVTWEDLPEQLRQGEGVPG